MMDAMGHLGRTMIVRYLSENAHFAPCHLWHWACIMFKGSWSDWGKRKQVRCDSNTLDFERCKCKSMWCKKMEDISLNGCQKQFQCIHKYMCSFACVCHGWWFSPGTACIGDGMHVTACMLAGRGFHDAVNASASIPRSKTSGDSTILY